MQICEGETNSFDEGPNVASIGGAQCFAIEPCRQFVVQFHLMGAGKLTTEATAVRDFEMGVEVSQRR